MSGATPGELTRRDWLAWAGGSSALGMVGACGGRDPALAQPGSLGSVPGLPSDVTGDWVGAHADRGHAWRDARWPVPATGLPVRRTHTVIVGAGIAGLSAARALRQAGIDDVAVLDLEDEPGGNARGHWMLGQACPLGAHYLPMPGPDAREVARWLEEIGLIQWRQGRWVGDERHLCHSPQERLFVPDSSATSPASVPSPAAQGRSWWPGSWQDGLLPWQGQSLDVQAQFRRFAQDVDRLSRQLGFAMPTTERTWNSGLDALDRQTFGQWLDAQGYTAPALRWLLDYACRDDYGAGLRAVSAWAGIHYFASRHGFELPGSGHEPHDAVLTWPQGNAWLAQRLAMDLGERWQAGAVALRVQPARHEVRIDTWSVPRNRAERWIARQVILAVPLFVAVRLLNVPPPALRAIQPLLQYAPWLVSNLALREPLLDRPGAPLSWDNVAYNDQGIGDVPVPALGYVNARHQSLKQTPDPGMLLTHYWALGRDTPQATRQHRQQLLEGGWSDWAARVVADMARVHPDLPRKLQRIDLMRWGHAMVIPRPGLRGHAALSALHQPAGRVHMAHSDLSAYSVFEEAFTHGVRAGRQVALASSKPRRKL